MSKLLLSFAIASAFLFSIGTPARALSAVTFVSGKGVDAGACAAPAKACRTFQYAHDQTSASGEIKALDPADYFPVTINRSISITGVHGAGILRASNGDAIAVNVGASDFVNISHLTLDGLKIASNGIALFSGGSLTIKNCVIRNFNEGIRIAPYSGATKFLITDAAVSNNNDGVFIESPESGSVVGVLDHVLSNKNSNYGVVVLSDASPPPPSPPPASSLQRKPRLDIAHDASAAETHLTDVTAIGSLAVNNSGAGFFVGALSTLRLNHSVATANGLAGVRVDLGGVAESAANNFIRGNFLACGTLLCFESGPTNVGTQ